MVTQLRVAVARGAQRNRGDAGEVACDGVARAEPRTRAARGRAANAHGEQRPVGGKRRRPKLRHTARDNGHVHQHELGVARAVVFGQPAPVLDELAREAAERERESAGGRRGAELQQRRRALARSATLPEKNLQPRQTLISASSSSRFMFCPSHAATLAGTASSSSSAVPLDDSMPPMAAGAAAQRN